MSDYIPPFTMTNRISKLSIEIGEQVGKLIAIEDAVLGLQRKKENRARSIHASLAIEGNSLSFEEVRAIAEGKRVITHPAEVREVRNTVETYDMVENLDPLSVKSLLKAHQKMMQGMISENGKFRSCGVGVYAGRILIHMAPPYQFVPEQIQNLLNWYKESDLHPLIKSAIFHYEFEFIHPFADGNGRTGRLWHTLLLGEWKEIFLYLPIEEFIYKRQQEYYEAIGKSTREGESGPFVEFMLEVLRETLKETLLLWEAEQAKRFSSKRILLLLKVLSNETLSAAEIMERLNLTSKPSFRTNYLLPALEAKLIEMTVPDKPNSRDQKYRRK